MHLRAVLRQSEGLAASFTVDAARSIDRRGSERRSLSLMAPSSIPTTGELPVRILDISQGGLLLEIEDTALSVGENIEVELPVGPVAAQVAWRSGSYVGCQFSKPVAPAAISAALLKADPLVASEGATTLLDTARMPLGLRPELNLSAAFILALASWGLISLAVYLTIV
jgi:hypothetical protein